MPHSNSTKRNVLLICLFLGPLFQLIGDSLWINHNYRYSWNIWRESSYIFFIPAGFLLAKIIERKSVMWAIIACTFYTIGCFGSAAMMPLFRLGAFYTINGHNEFPAIVQSVLGNKAFGATLFLPGLCFPISLVIFGIGFLKYKLLVPLLSASFIVAGIVFFMGNALEMDAVLVIGDVWLLIAFCRMGLIYKKKMFHEESLVSFH